MESEKPETGSSQGSLTAGLMLMLTTSVVGFVLFYLLIQNGYIVRLPEATNAVSLKDTLVVIMVSVSIVLTIYNVQARLPVILADKDAMDSKTRFMKGTLIPMGIMVFFVLFVYQFMMNTTQPLSIRGMLGILATAIAIGIGAMVFRMAVDNKVVVIGSILALVVAGFLVMVLPLYKKVIGG
jgi:high-affinity Fe2+/Pb2+ permease